MSNQRPKQLQNMSRHEMVSRIVVLETMVLKISELVVREFAANGDKPAIDDFLYSLGEGVGYRGKAMSDEMSDKTYQHMRNMMTDLDAMLAPKPDKGLAPTMN